ncbi:MAG: phosphatase PAP2 family protein [Gemmatimonadota bacterium]|nr:phosphatase PAP2 family protein [Gemmatimonadota bacterium]
MKRRTRTTGRLHFRKTFAVVSLGLLSAAPAIKVRAQQPVPDTSATSRTGVFTRRDALTAAAFAIGTAAIMPLDRRIAVVSQRASLQNNSALGHTLTGFREIGEPGSIILAGAAYLYGRGADSPRSAELGLRTIESIGFAGITTVIIKGFAGRARPYVVSDTNPHDYKAGRGFHDDAYTSFPSGHVTVAFAAASAASQEISYLWPHASHLWTPALFASASIVGVARIYEDKHWASDVVAGAAVGTIVSRIVVQYSRAHPRNSIDRLLLPTAVSPSSTGRGVAFSWDVRW